MTPTEFLLVSVLSMLGATAQGAIGIGYGLVAGAGLVAIDPAFVPGPLLIIGVVVGCRHIVVERDHLDLPAWKRCMLGLPVGLIAGISVLEAMDDRTLGLAVGAAIALAAVALLAGVTVKRTPAIEVATGAGSAFAAVTASLPGPPFVVAFSDLRPAAMRATSASFLVALTVLSFFSLVATGNFARDEFELLALMLPGTVAGLFVSRFVRPHLESQWFRPLILIIAGIGGIALIIRNL
ncbi:MAG: TSUP family transporter [Acidimicrobiales bacterium]|nr:TSUP family transporter [Acidimicrobiales bacterium]RZV48255.1 MAG: hypothetical protein EX269_02360 [Acidimicrobiales bacterium]